MPGNPETPVHDEQFDEALRATRRAGGEPAKRHGDALTAGEGSRQGDDPDGVPISEPSGPTESGSQE